MREKRDRAAIFGIAMFQPAYTGAPLRDAVA
jgi:hypothetical protein